MSRILLEDTFGEFIVNRDSIVTESTEGGRSVKRISGRISVCDTVNGNKRRYPRHVWEKNLANGSRLRQLIEKNAAWGLLEHPADGKVDLRSPIAVRLVSIQLEDNGDVTGEIRVLPTPEGMRLQALIDEGYNPTVSTRGYGSIVNRDGIDEVDDDYVCEGADVVACPSVENAIMTTVESTDPTRKTSSQKPAVVESQPPLKQSPARSSAVSAVTPKSMDINNIKAQLESLRKTDATKLTPQSFAEGMSLLANLHREVSAYVAEDQARSWDGSQLHSSISEVENKWSSVVESTKVEASNLRGTVSKLAKVGVAVAEVAQKYKEKLAESVVVIRKQRELIETLTKRGRGWRAVAESRRSEYKALSENYQLSTDGLDVLAERYINDVTRLGRRLIEVEFPEAVKNEFIAVALRNARHPDEIASIRETKIAKASPAPKASADKSISTNPAPAPTTEAVKGKEEKAAASVAVVTEGQKEERGPIGSMQESVALAQRLSATIAN